MKILLAEDQTMVRTALASLLRLEADYEVDEAVDGAAAQQQLQQEHYDILLTDIEMPHLSGLELLQWVQQHQPALKTVIITTFNRAGYIKRAVDAGVSGFLLKDAPIATLIDSLHKVCAGARVISNELLLQALGQQDPLTEKERKALRLAGQGMSTQAIAEALFIAEGTARNYLSEAISKLHANNRVEAARFAHQQGWL
ncbi:MULTISPECIES: response regulator transcription factor [Idiomarinaceae]|uniref:LuxR family two component transcriptional regulator n=4 Tax=Pseudidiomarina TaxID=2800384 RepID=A0A368US38_9GAMM|nr:MULTISPECIES: response regulator transcription factor [Idiomarinaceae]MDT7525617.1 response regulator transcription factor [Pseudidiomarina sp. GXY010]MRJ43153.1 response regulator [Idiomarina sp. FeN1]NCU57165.1 response regulator [Idiomarina sp. FenA--70]NCU59874.1 response regulator [Idiomarina sp. FenBw--71]PWW07951.1 LuxR family two component transcriptional regulator [Pseudidiomarina maritima]